MTDLELLAAYCTAGSHEAFSQIVLRHTDMVYSTCLRVLGDAHSAEDAAQATFMTLMHRATKNELNKETALGGWLYRTACQSALNMRTIRTRQARHQQEAMLMRAPDVERPESRWEEIRPYLDGALKELSDAQQEVIVSRFLRGQSLSETAVELGCSEETVRTRQRRGLEKLRAKLQERGVGLSVVLLAAMLTDRAVGAAPASLASRICDVCSLKTAPSVVATELTAMIEKGSVAPWGIAAATAAMLLLSAGIGATLISTNHLRSTVAPVTAHAATKSIAAMGRVEKGLVWVLHGNDVKNPENWMQTVEGDVLPEYGQLQTDAESRAELRFHGWGRVVMGPATMIHWGNEGRSSGLNEPLRVAVVTGQLMADPEERSQGFLIENPGGKSKTLLAKKESVRVKVTTELDEKFKGEKEMLKKDSKTKLRTGLGLVLAAAANLMNGGNVASEPEKVQEKPLSSVLLKPSPVNNETESSWETTPIGCIVAFIEDKKIMKLECHTEYSYSLPSWEDETSHYQFSTENLETLKKLYDAYTYASVNQLKKAWNIYELESNMQNAVAVWDAVKNYGKSEGVYRGTYRKLARMTSDGAVDPSLMEAAIFTQKASTKKNGLLEKTVTGYVVDINDATLEESVRRANEHISSIELLKSAPFSIDPELANVRISLKIPSDNENYEISDTLSLEQLAQKLADAVGGKVTKQPDGTLRIERKEVDAKAGGEESF